MSFEISYDLSWCENRIEVMSSSLILQFSPILIKYSTFFSLSSWFRLLRNVKVFCNIRSSEQVIYPIHSKSQNPILSYQNSATQVIKPKRKAKKHKLLPSQFLRRPEMSLPGIQPRWLGSPTGRQLGKRQRLRHRGDRPVLRLPRRPRLPTRIGRTLQADVLLADVTELPLPREAPLGKGL